MVIFMPACKIEIGKSGLGLELSHNLNLLLTFPVCKFSTSLSKRGIQLSDKWQLAKNIHCPSLAPVWIILKVHFVVTSRE